MSIITSHYSFLTHLLQRNDHLGRGIVLTSGIFDVLHVGHIRCLKEAASIGMRLIVGVNSDERVRALKGPGRPIMPLDERMELLSALRCVDYVTTFNEDTPAEMILSLRPEIFAKGTDYKRPLPEDWAIDQVGARVVFCGDIKTHGSRDVIQKLG